MLSAIACSFFPEWNRLQTIWWNAISFELRSQVWPAISVDSVTSLTKTRNCKRGAALAYADGLFPLARNYAGGLREAIKPVCRKVREHFRAAAGPEDLDLVRPQLSAEAEMGPEI